MSMALSESYLGVTLLNAAAILKCKMALLVSSASWSGTQEDRPRSAMMAAGSCASPLSAACADADSQIAGAQPHAHTGGCGLHHCLVGGALYMA